MFIKTLFDFPGRKDEIKDLVSRNFFNSIMSILHSDYVFHHSHVTGKIWGYAHDFCNRKVRENRGTISVIAHYLFIFDFFFLL